MKKVLMLILSCVMVFSMFACGDKEKDISPITKEEISALYTEPGDFEGRLFEFTAQVLTVEKADGVLYIQAYHDIVNYEENTVIVYEGEDISLSADDYINVMGTITGEFKGENMFGGVVKAPQVQADKLEKITAVEAFPADRTVDVNETVTKGKYKATLQKVDFTETETRVYVKVENASSSTFDVYADQGVIVQNGKQYENQYNYLYGDISTSIKSGASTEGVIAFDRVEESGFTYSFTGYDNNFNELEFKFDVNVE